MTTFLSLPLELRQEIYTMLCLDAVVVEYGEKRYRRVDDTSQAVSLVNRQIQEEFASTIFGQGAWVQSCTTRNIGSFAPLRVASIYVKNLAIKMQVFHTVASPLSEQGLYYFGGYNWEGRMQNRSVFEKNLASILSIVSAAENLRSLELFWEETFVFRDRTLEELCDKDAVIQRADRLQSKPDTSILMDLKEILRPLTYLPPSCMVSIGKTNWVQVSPSIPDYPIVGLEAFPLAHFRGAVTKAAEHIIERKKATDETDKIFCQSRRLASLES